MLLCIIRLCRPALVQSDEFRLNAVEIFRQVTTSLMQL